MSVKWTEAQLAAITARGGSLLVSAAAGSGKTAVLVERLLRRIEDEGHDITEFLIITFTKAAAGELRRKIADELYARAAQRPGDRHLRRQLALVQSARISTVHAFCTWLLQNYGDNPALAGGFRILDDAEGKILAYELLEELAEKRYEEKTPSFTAFAEYMSGDRSDKPMLAAVMELFEKSRSHPEPEKWLSDAAAAYTMSYGEVTDTVWGAYAKREAEETIHALAERVTVLMTLASRDTEAESLYSEILRGDAAKLNALCELSWDELYHALCAFEFERLPSSRKLADKTVPEYVKAVRGCIKDELEALLKKCITDTSDTLLTEIIALAPYASELCRLAAELGMRFEEEKLRRGVLDYSDLEHFALRLLVESYDAKADVVVPSATAREVAKGFCEILLDEFQDSNSIQDIIFRAVSRDEKNIVMVGDVKQSIYRFRLADPTIFVKKYKNFIPYTEAKDGEPRTVVLSKNFRSRGEVISAANAMFSALMSERLGGIDYTERECLVPRDGIPDSGERDNRTELILLDIEQDGEIGAKEAEAEYVAKKIDELIRDGFTIDEKDGTRRAVRYGDFAILLRSAKTNSEYFERALAAHGIPFASPRADGLLQKTEINVVLSLLTVIDNPVNDIPLISVLRSPLFGFTADELCHIRRAGAEYIIFSMEKLARAEGATAEKCRAFLSLLRELRALSLGMSADRLIWTVYDRTNALGMFGAMKNGGARQKNLIEFYKCAQSFERAGYHGLYGFIAHIAKLAERDGDIPAPSASAENAVTIMTIHKSKGLEFPVVFLANCIRVFNADDINRPMLIHPEFGIGLPHRDFDMMTEQSTIARDMAARALTDEMKSEEMRILYVAVTRAREKLFMVGANKNMSRTLSKMIAENPQSKIGTDDLRRRMGTLDWMLLPLLKSREGEKLRDYAGYINAAELPPFGDIAVSILKPEDGAETVQDTPEQMKTADTETKETVEERFAFSYAAHAAASAPSKVTATGLYDIKHGAYTERRAVRPRFIREKSLNAAERGIALHTAMQFCDFAKCCDIAGTEAELSRLLAEKYITKQQHDAIDACRIVAFARSDIGRRVLSAKEVLRERKFSVLLPADKLLEDETLAGETVLLQGVMDMCFTDENGATTILDFKTDAHRPSGDILQKYAEQLTSYSTALFEMTGKHAAHRIIYLVTCGEAIEV